MLDNNADVKLYDALKSLTQLIDSKLFLMLMGGSPQLHRDLECAFADAAQKVKERRDQLRQEQMR